MVPNSVFPLIVYQIYARTVTTRKNDPARAFEQVFAANRWSRSWRNGIYPFHHYHATAHEVLGIAQGSARVCMGGEQGVRLTIGPGDVMVIPAGVGHKNLGASSDLLVVGAYPDGQHPDLCRESAREHEHALEKYPQSTNARFRSRLWNKWCRNEFMEIVIGGVTLPLNGRAQGHRPYCYR